MGSVQALLMLEIVHPLVVDVIWHGVTGAARSGLAMMDVTIMTRPMCADSVLQMLLLHQAQRHGTTVATAVIAPNNISPVQFTTS